MLVPDQAVVTDQTRQAVYVVAADGMVSERMVEVGPIADGLRVIRSGLSPSDTIVIDGIQRAKAGHKVQMRQGTITATAPQGPAGCDHAAVDLGENRRPGQLGAPVHAPVPFLHRPPRLRGRHRHPDHPWSGRWPIRLWRSPSTPRHLAADRQRHPRPIRAPRPRPWADTVAAPHRGADQRRREHALHVLPVDGGTATSPSR